MTVNVAPSTRTERPVGASPNQIALVGAAQDPPVGMAVPVDHQGDPLQPKVGEGGEEPGRPLMHRLSAHRDLGAARVPGHRILGEHRSHPLRIMRVPRRVRRVVHLDRTGAMVDHSSTLSPRGGDEASSDRHGSA